MGRRNRQRKEILPTYYVFCEGQSEHEYILMLKRHFRMPSVVVKPSILGNKISAKIIHKAIKGLPRHPKDKVFLLYDLDVEEVAQRLVKIDGVILLTSNPCFEVWMYLHFSNLTNAVESNDILNRLKSLDPFNQYKKGSLKKSEVAALLNNMETATERALNLNHPQNPSSSVHLLVTLMKNHA
ncbi:MAG: RloB family protein [Bacteroidetes bacterium]|nr:RloB family protein [Bacteroidota bacterium]